MFRLRGCLLLPAFLLGSVACGAQKPDTGLNRDLAFAVKNGQYGTAKNLLDRGADPNAKAIDSDGSVLADAAGWGHVQIVELLLQRGAKVDLADNENRTPLIAAAMDKKTEAARLLLRKGAKPNTVTKSGGTALLFAAITGNAELVGVLLDGGADINLADAGSAFQGFTPLMHAAWNVRGNAWTVQAAVVRALLSRGANIAQRDAHGSTALDYARKKAAMSGQGGAVEVVHILEASSGR